MKRVYIDNFKIHDIEDSALSYFLAKPIEGLEASAFRMSSLLRAGDDGNRITSNYLGERRIGMTGGIRKVSTSSQHSSLRQALSAAVIPTRDSDGVNILKELRLVDLDDNEFRLLGDFRNIEMPLEHNTFSEFALDFLAETAFIHGYAEKSLTIVTLSRGGFILPVEVPIVFSSGTGGTGVANNAGGAPSLPVVTLTGPLTNPRLTNETTGEFIALTATIADGETYVIDMEKLTIVQGGITNRMSTKTAGSFFPLATGDNTLSLTTSIDGEEGTAKLTWRDAYYGL